MTPRSYAIAAGGVLFLLVAAFGAGRYTAPVKIEIRETVKTETRTVTDDAAVSKAVATAHSEWQRSLEDHSTIKTVYVAGKVSERIVYRDVESHAAGGASSGSTTTVTVEHHQDAATVQTVEKVKIVESARPAWAIEAHGAWGSLQPYPEAYAGEVQRRILGPLWVGAGIEHSDKWRPMLSARMEF